MGKTRSSRRVSSLATPTRQSAEEILQQEAEVQSSLDRKAKAIVEESRRRLRDLVGRKAYDDVRAAIRNERRALQELRQPPEGLKRDFWADHRAGRKRIDALLRKHGVSSDKVKRIHQDTREKLGNVLAPAGANTVPGYSLANHHHHYEDLTGLDPDAVSTISPPHEDPNDPHRWIPFVPPYPECDAYRVPLPYGSTDQGFEVDVKPYCSNAGLIGSDITCSKSDTGDGDYAWPHTKSYVKFPIQMPTAGRLEIVVMALCVRDYHETSMVDEFGSSYAYAHHDNSMYMYMVAGGRVEEHRAPMSYVATDSDHPPLMGQHLIPGTYHFAYFTTDTIIGTANYSLSIGNINFNGVLTNDMAVRSKSSCLWLLHSVACRIKP
jgi:hypothetical protein